VKLSFKVYNIQIWGDYIVKNAEMKKYGYLLLKKYDYSIIMELMKNL
jgi:hypothetical protein